MSEILLSGKCNIGDCPKTARWQIGFRVWPANIGVRTRGNAVEGLTSVCVCDEHAIRDPDAFFTAKGKQQIAIGFLNAGRGMPDFSTAEVIHTDISNGGSVSKEEAARLGGLSELGA